MESAFKTQKSIVINNKEIIVNYPNVGKKLEIEKTKILLTDGLYGELVRTSCDSSNAILDIIDAFSWFKVCCPQLKLEIDNFKDIDPVTERSMVLSYKTEVYPWMSSVEKQLSQTEIVDEPK